MTTRPPPSLLAWTCAALALALALLIPSCTPTNQLKGTALFLSIAFPAVAVDQVRISAANGGGLVTTPTLRPLSPSPAALPSPQTVHLLLPDSAAGQATVYVDALFEGQVVAVGKQDAPVTVGLENQVEISLAAGQGCGPCAGCCDGATCIASPDATHCGAPGGTCLSCGVAANACNGGECMCGSGGSCSSGQQCVDGACKCTPQSCADGCCTADNFCIRLTSGEQGNLNCGNAGRACASCRTSDATACQGGVCTNACTTASCMDGCCSGDTCIHFGNRSLDACGVSAAACVVCDPTRADQCGPRGCQCGVASACEIGQVCVAGVCVAS